jgi:hypothetical protein
MASQASPGQILAKILFDALHAYQIGSVVGDHARQIIWGVTPQGAFVDGQTLDNFLAKAGQILRDSGRLYRFGNTIAYETDAPGDQRLTTLAVQHRAEPNATPIMANLFGTAYETKQGVVQSLATSKLIGAVLADESLWQHLPEIKYYARRPTFDPDFNLCTPGWNEDSGILVHAPEVVPTFHAPASAPDASAIDRLPPRLRALLGEFAWRSDADLVNALAMALTGLLINHFVDDPHPGGLVDANQPGTGKTLYVQVIGRILDGTEPPRTSLVRDEELEKRLCAQLRRSRTSLFFLDNVRARIESAVLEQNMLSPVLSFRILGRSDTIERPNTALWMITSNLTAGTPDFIRRCVPIRQFVDGDPKARVFTGSPLAYATQHRLEILGELAGMVLRWVELGRSTGPQKHRCEVWAATIGGILAANGLGEFFLANADEAEQAMDQGLLDLATLAEHVVAKGPVDLRGSAGDDLGAKGRTASEWAPVFTETQVLRDKLVDGTTKGRATAIGLFLSGKVNRRVRIETADGPRAATLRRRDGTSNQKFHYFEIGVLPAPDGQPTHPSALTPVGAPMANGEVPAPAPVPPPMAADGQSTLSSTPSFGTDVAATSDHPPAVGDLEWVGP